MTNKLTTDASPSTPQNQKDARAFEACRPILFSGPMIRAILNNSKSQTRRVVKFPLIDRDFACELAPSELSADEVHNNCPYGKPGNRLWVRENLIRPDGDPWLYAADSVPVMVSAEAETAMLVWAHHKQQDYCPSMFMPRWASRITLEITEVRVERLQAISEADARDEGCRPADHATGRECILSPEMGSYRLAYQSLWDSINGKKYPWSRNPFVWVVGFKRVGAGV